MSAKKVYCSMCRFLTLRVVVDNDGLRTGETAYTCDHKENKVVNDEGDWYSMRTITLSKMTPEQRNKNNDCPWYVPR